MLRHNVFACARDTSEGVRRPRFTTAARSGPYPPLDRRKQAGGTEDGGGPPRRPSCNAVGTANTPVIVISDRKEVAGCAWGGIPTPVRNSPQHGGDQTAAASFSDMIGVEGSASDKASTKQGVGSSGHDTGPPAVLSAAFTSTEFTPAHVDESTSEVSSRKDSSVFGSSDYAAPAGVGGRGSMAGGGRG